MAYNFSFKDNETYGAEDINNITKRLVTSGISDVFKNGTPYNLLALNDLGAVLYTSGAVPETVNSLKVTRLTDDKLLINPGMAFFADGAVFEVLAGGEEIACLKGTKQYVYLKNDLINSNVCYPACTESMPTGDCVLLAEISENDEITDKRTYAKGKLPGYASNENYVLEIKDTVEIKDSVSEAKKTYNIGANTYRFLLVMQKGEGGDKGEMCLGIYDFTDGTYISFGVHSNSARCLDTEKLTLWHRYDRFLKGTVSFANGVLTLGVEYFDYTATKRNLTVPINLYLF
ncbi:MAG: hypothetical protein IKU87_02415 [Clostridia bacterium]|nr:hypothetical protein [Clostridia bacterium]